MDDMKKVRFDPTINAGHLLTFVGFLVTIFIGWTNLDKRVVVLEENKNAQALRDKHQDAIIAGQSAQIRETLSDIKTAIIRLDQKIEAIK